MSTLTPFWRLLESRPSRTAVAAEWKRVAGDCFPVIEPMLSPTGQMATRYPDLQRPGRWLRVIRHNDGLITAVDADDWQRRVQLQRDDIVLHRLNPRAIRKVVCETLSCLNIARTPVDEATTCFRIANWEPKKAASFPVFLVMCQQASGLSHAVLELGSNNAKPGAILLTPTRANWTEAIDTRARDQKLMLVTLNEVLTPVSDGLAETPAWEEYLQAFCQLVGTTLLANYRNKRSAPIRGTRTADIEKLERALESHLLAARDHAYTQIDRGQEPTLLPLPQQQVLAKNLGMTTSSVSRCRHDKRAVKLRILWDAAESLESVLNYQRRR